MTAQYAECWAEAVWAVIVFEHPEHLACDPWWSEADTIVCGCRLVLFTYQTLPVAGEVL